MGPGALFKLNPRASLSIWAILKYYFLAVTTATESPDLDFHLQTALDLTACMVAFFFQPMESFMLTEFELSPASLLWTCPAITGPEPNCDLQIDFPAWTWICLIILILLYDLGYYLDSTAISRPVLLVLLGYLQDWALVGEAPAGCVILLSSLTCRKQPCSCCSLTQGISEFLYFSFCYFIHYLF